MAKIVLALPSWSSQPRHRPKQTEGEVERKTGRKKELERQRKKKDAERGKKKTQSQIRNRSTATPTAVESLRCGPLCSPMDCSTPGFFVLHYNPEFAQTHVHSSVMPSNHLILGLPLLLLPSIFPSIKVFSNESDLPIRWPQYWSFSFCISPSNEYSGLISFNIDCFDLFAVQGILKSLLQHHRTTTTN